MRQSSESNQNMADSKVLPVSHGDRSLKGHSKNTPSKESWEKTSRSELKIPQRWVGKTTKQNITGKHGFTED